MSAGKCLPAFRKDIITDVKETLYVSEVSVTICQLTRRKFLEELKLHEDCCKNQNPRVNTAVCRNADTFYSSSYSLLFCYLHLLQYKPGGPR